jgi:hypothetical protein
LRPSNFGTWAETKSGSDLEINFGKLTENFLGLEFEKGNPISYSENFGMAFLTHLGIGYVFDRIFKSSLKISRY